VRVIAQSIEQLRSVGLRVDRLQLVPLDEIGVLVAVDDGTGDVRPGTDGMDVGPFGAGPGAGKGTERAEVGERVVVAVSLGVDVRSVVVRLLRTSHRRTITLDVPGPLLCR